MLVKASHPTRHLQAHPLTVLPHTLQQGTTWDAGWLCMYPHRPGAKAEPQAMWELAECLSIFPGLCTREAVRSCCGPSKTVSHHLPGSDEGQGFLSATLRVQLQTVTPPRSSFKLAPRQQGVPSFVMQPTASFHFGVTCTRATSASWSFDCSCQ